MSDSNELELMRKLTLEKEARREQRKQEVAESMQFNKDTETIPCQGCGRTVRQVMASRVKRMEAGEEAGLGRFDEKDGVTTFTCIDCGSKSPV